jgi:hypothetical protein
LIALETQVEKTLEENAGLAAQLLEMLAGVLPAAARVR